MGLFVMAGPNTTQEVYTSPDSLAWTARAVTLGSPGVQKNAAWSSGLQMFCAIGTKPSRSSDGITWLAPISSGLMSGASAIGASSSMFVVVGRNFSSGIYNPWTSTDGGTWTERSFPIVAGDNGFFTIVWSSTLGLWVAFGKSSAGNVITFTSTNGTSWTRRTPSLGTVDILGAAWSPSLGLFVAHTGGGESFRSSDGISWTANTALSPCNFRSICWAASLGLFVAVGSSNGGANLIARSSDGISWTVATGVGSAGILPAIAWDSDNSRLCAIGAPTSGTGYSIYSSDAVNWTLGGTVPVSTSWQGGLVWGNPPIPPTNLSPGGIASGFASGAVVIAPGSVSVLPSAVDTSEAVPTPVARSVMTLSPSGASTEEAHGEGLIVVGPTHFDPVGIASSEAFGFDFVNLVQYLDLVGGIASSELLGNPTTIPGLYAIPVQDGIDSLESFGAPFLVRNVNLSLTGILSSEVFGATFLHNFVVVSPTGIDTAQALGVVSLAIGASPLSPLGIPTAEIWGLPFFVPNGHPWMPSGAYPLSTRLAPAYYMVVRDTHGRLEIRPT